LSLEPVLIAGAWTSATDPSGEFTAFDPTTKAPLTARYPISSAADVERVFAAAGGAVAALRTVSHEARAAFLERYAANLEARAAELVEVAARETALPAEPRLRSVELPRTVGQMRQAAAAVRERSWCRATIDSKANLRSLHAPLGGPVLILGPNNFPFAFNAASGGDFVAAIAAGNPVIAKGHPSHPGTTKLLAECGLEAARAARIPVGILQLLYAVPNELGLQMVADRRLGATAFTGSRAAGLRLKAAAELAGKPIYLELSANNPVFFLPAALVERGPALVGELFDSCALGAGQFCTRPGLSVIVDGPAADEFVSGLRARFQQAAPGTLLAAGLVSALSTDVAALVQAGARVLSGGHAADREKYAFEPTLLEVSGQTFLEAPAELGRECFGALHVVVRARDAAELLRVASALPGNLTGSIYTSESGSDDSLYAELAPLVRDRVGRLLNDKMPTGVAVSSGMNHGGPYPSTGHPGFTAVGIPASLLRFTALHSYDAVRPARLPAELQDRNPTGKMWRLIDGGWSQGDVAVTG
jgi:alpha-ketoglutaric semialdehyde dehydrogenase